ncbi:MAG: hypothetical protein J2P27_10635 [Actinobacteria bacterium]|nr:hypothetical protein [Actinomycetota bacterium]
MRKLIVLAAATLALCGCGVNGQPANAPAAPSATTAPSSTAPVASSPVWLDDLQMVSAQVGWALAWNADPSGTESVPLELVRTTDGARDWQRVTLPGHSALTPGSVVLDAISAQQAWLAVGLGKNDNPTSGTTTVYRTTDGGLDWSAGAPLSGSAPAEIDFIGSDGWLLEDLGAAMQQQASTLWRTVNAGATWSLAAKTPPIGQPPSAAAALPTTCDKNGLAFASAQLGWITSFCNVLSGAILVTRDGGAHWATQPVPLPGLLCQRGGCEVYAPQFAGSATFLQVDAYPSAGYLLVSENSGRTWTTLRMPAGAGPYPRIRFFSATDAIAVSAGPQGAIGPDFYLTADGGRTWTAVPQGRRFGASASFDFVTPALGFAWTSEGQQLFATSDSGRTWTALTQQPS